MKKSTSTSRRSSKPAAKAAGSRKTAPKAKAKPAAKAKAKAKPTAKAKAAPAKKLAKPTKKVSAKARRKQPGSKSPASSRAASGAQWVKFVEQHAVVLASARGPVPSVAEAVAGEPIVGSWWAHPKGDAIFDALSSIDDSPDIRCFKLVDGKVTFVHKKAWAALVRLGRDGVIAPEQLAAVQQEHTPSGEHRNLITPFPDWVDADTSSAADTLTTEQARAQLAWVEG